MPPGRRAEVALERELIDAMRFFGYTDDETTSATPTLSTRAERNDALAAADQVSDDGAWKARWVVAKQDGRLVVRSLTIEPTGPATPLGGVTANLLRGLSPADLTKAVAGQVGRPEPGVHEPEDIGSFAVRTSEVEAARVDPVVDDAPKVGRPPLSDEHLAQVAEAYIVELLRGRGILRRMGERFDRTPEAMRDQVKAARKRGFLTESVKSGRAGAEPGPRLLEMRRAQMNGDR